MIITLHFYRLKIVNLDQCYSPSCNVLIIIVVHNLQFINDYYRGALIKRRLKKIAPFRPIEFAQLAQQKFIDVNKAIQRLATLLEKEEISVRVICLF